MEIMCLIFINMYIYIFPEQSFGYPVLLQAEGFF